MLFFTDLQITFPDLAFDGSNWIVWKARMQILIRAERLGHIIDDSAIHPAKPEPLADTATAAEVAAFNAASEKYQKFEHSDAVAMYIIMSAISDDLLLKNIRHTTGRSLWKAICVEYEQLSLLWGVRAHSDPSGHRNRGGARSRRVRPPRTNE